MTTKYEFPHQDLSPLKNIVQILRTWASEGSDYDVSGLSLDEIMAKISKYYKVLPIIPADQPLSQGVKLIEIERYEQINKHGYSIQRDTDNNAWGELIAAASALIQPDQSNRTMFANMPIDWSDASCLKMCSKPYKDRLVIAGAFIAAELDCLIHQESVE